MTKTFSVKIGNISVGGGAPVVIQSMTNTSTQHIKETADQIIELHNAGAKIVRITVNNADAAKATPYIKELVQKHANIPIVGCFHYNGHTLLNEFPECAKSLDKYRINPGNMGFGEKRDIHFESIIECALKYNKPIRIGVNWGSLDKKVLSQMMDENSQNKIHLSSEEIVENAMVESALMSARKALRYGMSENQIVLSAKTSKVQSVVRVYKKLHSLSRFPLHVGLTEAGIGLPGAVSTAAALSILLSQGIGDTIRCSITPKLGESRIQEIKICKAVLDALEIERFQPKIAACPGCGRTSSTYFQKLAEDVQNFIDCSMLQWKAQYQGIENLNIAVMGCIVNGPGESKHADIGISLPGSGEEPVAPVFINGKKQYTLRGDNIANDFKDIITLYIQNNFSAKK
ncbi:MAG: flavodoxin-dependent (E)-4-hydroxy-3-methylbut-2-enyl-diphosphate synthase [Proteobacteria bacterium]|nr:flavodoxin-dependent (E)-4-hydroxy-3-methylbut-2-enyl-diphosphate synthase [Pseudomonadota bacterium]